MTRAEKMEGDEFVAARVIDRIVALSEAIAWQAGVGGMETAGSIVSYLARHPADLPKLLAGTLSVLDWPAGWHVEGRLSWHGLDGKIHTPEEARRRRTIEKLKDASK